MRRGHRRVLIGAALLMATSAVGPGFLTQTVVFTERLGASFAFAILLSIGIDLAAQINIWRVLTISGMRATEVGNAVLPGVGTVLAVLVALGGLAFNVGNVAGAGLGLEVALGLPVAYGAALSAALAILLFLVKDAGRAMDRFAIVLAMVLIVLIFYVAIAARPPVALALTRSVFPERIDVLSIVTIVGGTVGGYITFAGAHRLVDAGIHGLETIQAVTRTSLAAIGVASVMRVVLFLAALGIVQQGLALDPTNPAASVFRHATGEIGVRVFGGVMWIAAITSLVGASYTSVSFLRGLHPALNAHWTRLVIVFIVAATVSFLVIGRPVRVLVAVGALNGMILPLGLATMLVAAHRQSIVGAYRHPRFLTLCGVVVAVAMAAAGALVVWQALPALFR